MSYQNNNNYDKNFYLFDSSVYGHRHNLLLQVKFQITVCILKIVFYFDFLKVQYKLCSRSNR